MKSGVKTEIQRVGLLVDLLVEKLIETKEIYTKLLIFSPRYARRRYNEAIPKISSERRTNITQIPEIAQFSSFTSLGVVTTKGFQIKGRRRSISIKMANLNFFA